METKRMVSPFASLSHDKDGKRLRIELELPDVNRENISLDMKKDGFCILAPGNNDIDYQGCYDLEHEVEPEKTESVCEDGLLKIFTPFKGWEWKPTPTTLYVNAPIVRG